MAVGAGNLWRFPRVAAQNGGGAFLLPWLAFTLLWSLPLLMVEFGMGKKSRKGPVGAFSVLTGKRTSWMGGFVALCTIAIMFYYSVVTGWSAWYFVACIFRFETLSSDAQNAWATLSTGSPVAVGFHLAASVGCALILLRGVASGLERVCKVLVPFLAVLLLAAAVRGVTLPGGVTGLQFLFEVDPEKLGRAQTWLEALSQSAWSTGAGWGLMLTYASYSRKKEDVGLNCAITAVGDNSASVLAAMAILPAIFALSGSTDKAMAVTGAGNTGMTFIWIPQLFARMPAGGAFFAALFFAALTAASMSSLLAMMEMASRVFGDFGLKRKHAVLLVAGATFALGLPSALSLDFFNNQDWVWGLGLLISGVLFALGAARYGLKRFREQLVNTEGADWKVGRWFEVVVAFIIPAEFVVLMVWWFYQSVTVYAKDRWWDPLSAFSVSTCVVQWGVVLIVLIGLSGVLYRLSTKQKASSEGADESKPEEDRGGGA
jgi:NSS family neurotransmitter:Na+ symporter